MKIQDVHNSTILFSPMPKYFTDEQVKGIDKYMTEPIIDGVVQFIDGEYCKVDKEYEYESQYMFSPTWFEMMLVAQQQSQQTHDTHHVWLENFDIVGNQYVLATELGLSGGKSGKRKEKVILVRLGLGS